MKIPKQTLVWMNRVNFMVMLEDAIRSVSATQQAIRRRTGGPCDDGVGGTAHPCYALKVRGAICTSFHIGVGSVIS